VSHAAGRDPPPGWQRSVPEHLPKPTAVPFIFAFGVMLFGWGIISTPLVVVIGGLVLLVALFEWIREISHDAKQR
jgi:hypothetical protein